MVLLHEERLRHGLVVEWTDIIFDNWHRQMEVFVKETENFGEHLRQFWGEHPPKMRMVWYFQLGHVFKIRHVFKICVFSNTCMFSKRVCFLTFDNDAENQNYSLDSCRVKIFQRTDDRRNTHGCHYCSCQNYSLNSCCVKLSTPPLRAQWNHENILVKRQHRLPSPAQMGREKWAMSGFTNLTRRCSSVTTMFFSRVSRPKHPEKLSIGVTGRLHKEPLIWDRRC